MILAVDVGNTNIVLGCIEKGEILNIVRIQTSDRETAAEYAIKLKQVLEFYQVDCKGFEGAIISSVVPPVTEALRQAIFLITGVKAVVVGPGMKTGMNIRLDDPSTLAGDLVAGSVAAMSYYGAPVIVIDMGTATTMVVVDKEHCYRGGAIIPVLRHQPAAGYCHPPAAESHRQQHRGRHALRRDLWHRRHAGRDDRPHGGRTGRTLRPGGHRGPGQKHRLLLPA